MKVFHITVSESPSLESLIVSLRGLLSDIYKHKQESSVAVFYCKREEVAFGESHSITTLSEWEKVLRQLEMAQTISVFVSEGDVSDWTLDLLLISDFRYLAKKLRVGISTPNGAIRPGMALYRLANQLGQAQARRLGVIGRSIATEEACTLGLADETFDAGFDIVDHALYELKEVSSSELALRRRLLLEAHALEYDNALGAYLAACAINRAGHSA